MIESKFKIGDKVGLKISYRNEEIRDSIVKVKDVWIVSIKLEGTKIDFNYSYGITYNNPIYQAGGSFKIEKWVNERGLTLHKKNDFDIEKVINNQK